MLEGGDCLGLRRVDAGEEETSAVRRRGLPGEGGLRGREGQAAGVAGLGPEDPQLWRWAWLSCGWLGVALAPGDGPRMADPGPNWLSPRGALSPGLTPARRDSFRVL